MTLLSNPVESIRSLQSKLFENEEFTSKLNSALKSLGMLDGNFSPHLNSSKQKSTLIKDAVWGMMEFDATEMAIINSPLLQRLRRIKQLGFSSFTYPSAEHSRFIHSLGVAHIVKRFLDQTSQNAKKSPHVHLSDVTDTISAVECDSIDRRMVIHAALLHDIGHFPFSHATESAFHQNLETATCGMNFDDFLFLFEDKLAILEPKFAECFSAAIVLSETFFNFYKNCVNAEVKNDDLLKLALMICGIPPDHNSIGISSIISHSNVDADKIDYLNRDSMLCGIPIGIDSARLFFRTMFLKIPPGHLKELSPTYFESTTSPQTHFIVNASGIDTVDEIVHARSIMYQRVYRHKSTRLIERIFQKSLFPIEPEKLTIDAIDIWCDDESTLLSKVDSISAHPFKLRERVLPKRALVFSRSNILELAIPPISFITSESTAKITKDMIGSTLQRLDVTNLQGEDLSDFEKEICSEAQSLRDLFKSSGLPSSVNLPTSKCEIFALPLESIGGPNIKEDHIILSGNQLEYYKSASKSNPLADGNEVTKKIGYIFSSPEWCEIVHIAAIKKLYNFGLSDDVLEFDIESSESASKLSYTSKFILNREKSARLGNLDSARLESLEHHLANNTNYYDDCPFLCPVDTKSAPLTLDHFREFNGVGKWCIEKKHVVSFINQFPPRLREELIEIINNFKLIGRKDIGDGVLNIIEKINNCSTEFSGQRVIFEFTPNSGNSVRSLAEQEIKQKAKELGWKFDNSATKEKIKSVLDSDGVVLFIDDNIGSGTQARAQIRSFCGIDKNSWPDDLKSENNVSIGEKILNADINKGLIFVGAIVADEGGVRNINDDEVCQSYRVQTIYFKTLKEYGCFPELSDGLRNFLIDIGGELIKQNWENPSSDDCRNNALGYDNKCAVLATMWNVPTATLTPFWMPGVYNKMPWIPLFLRRGYQNRLVV